MNKPISKTIRVLTAIALLAVIGFLIYSHTATKGVAPVQVSENTPVPASGDWPSTKVSEGTVNDNKSYYTISATYPVTKDPVINDYFKSYIDDAVAQFKDDTSWAAGDSVDAPAEAASLSLTIKYIEQKSARADNYVFSVDTYTGGAHDLQATKTFTFSPTGQVINLASLFTNEAQGLKLISTYVQQQLAAMPNADSQMIKDGTVPIENNFESFVVTDDGITFTFDPYQVAPYSSGTQTVHVPVSVFKSVASKDIFIQ